jgi:XTP/dITP diphosphohydrolase
MSAPRVLLATRNSHKLVELQRILDAMTPRVELDVVGLGAVEAFDEVPESGATFVENAFIKAREAVARTGLPAIADDSGITVDALNGMPGVLSARWAGASRGDEANLRLLLEQLGDTPDERLGAGFVCAAVLVLPDGTEHAIECEMRGRLVREPRGDNGFGYDPIFVPDGYDRTSAELSPPEKDAISHRGQALRALAPIIAASLVVPRP